jgi:hypothetical protein
LTRWIKGFSINSGNPAREKSKKGPPASAGPFLVIFFLLHAGKQGEDVDDGIDGEQNTWCIKNGRG